MATRLGTLLANGRPLDESLDEIFDPMKPKQTELPPDKADQFKVNIIAPVDGAPGGCAFFQQVSRRRIATSQKFQINFERSWLARRRARSE